MIYKNSEGSDSTEDKFYNYYKKESLSTNYVEGAKSLTNMLINTFYQYNSSSKNYLCIADIGCGAGTHSMMMAKEGHRVFAIDMHNSLINLGIKRAKDANLSIEFKIGSAEKLPWSNKSMDICLALELIEHIPDFKKSISEFDRILKQGGILCISTTNKLCPVQYEFKLPLYSWYPNYIKKKCEKLAVTKYPEWVEFAKYPAINWFSFYRLNKIFNTLNYKCFDRFDVVDISNKGYFYRLLLNLLKSSKIFKLIGYILIPGTMIIAIKQ